MNRIEQALRKQLTEQYGLQMDDYRFHVESVYEDEPALLRWAVFYRPSNGACIRIDDIYTDRAGWPAQWAEPRFSTSHAEIMRGWMEADSA